MSILKKMDKDTKQVLAWVAAEYEYMNEFKDEIKEIKNEAKRKKRPTEKAKNILIQIGRCEEKVDSYGKNLDKDIQELLKKLPLRLKKECEDIDKNLRLAMNAILENTSRYVGALKKDVLGLEAQFDLLSKYSSNGPQKDKIYERINEIFKEIEMKTNYIISWISSLAVDLKRLQGFEKGLEKLSG